MEISTERIDKKVAEEAATPPPARSVPEIENEINFKSIMLHHQFDQEDARHFSALYNQLCSICYQMCGPDQIPNGPDKTLAYRSIKMALYHFEHAIMQKEKYQRKDKNAAN